MSETAMLNNKPRKSLANQLDRLDQVLDGLADNLNQAVADAVRVATAQAVQEAVHKALVEVLTNPELISLFNGAAGSTTPTATLPEAIPVAAEVRPTLGQRLGRAKDWAGQKVRAAGAACGRGVRAGLGVLGGVRSRLLTLWRLRKPLVVALAVGAAAGVAALAAGPWMAGLLTGVAGSVATLVIQAQHWLQHALGNFGVAADS